MELNEGILTGILAIVGIVAKFAYSFLEAHTQNATIKRVMTEVRNIVLSMNQVFEPELKAAMVDGHFDEQEKKAIQAKMKAKAIELLKQYLSAFVAAKYRPYCDALLDTWVEAEVNKTKNP